MIRCLVTGRLHDMPQARTSQSGNPFTTAKLRADSKDGATVWCSIIAFGELAERLAFPSTTWTTGSRDARGPPGQCNIRESLAPRLGTFF